MDPIAELKLILREDSTPFFGDAELQYHFEKAGDIYAAAYKLLLIKAEQDSLQISGLTTADTSAYWRRLAALYRPSASCIIRGE